MPNMNAQYSAKPQFEGEYFIPPVPIPNPRATADYRWYHGLLSIRKIANRL